MMKKDFLVRLAGRLASLSSALMKSLPLVLLPLALLRADDGLPASFAGIASTGLELSVTAGSVQGVTWPAATIRALPDRPQTLVLNLRTRALHTFTRAIGDGEIALARLETSNTAITRLERFDPVLPATRIPGALAKLSRGEPLKVAALGTSLVEAGWASEGWLRLLFGMGTEDPHYLVGGSLDVARRVVLSRYALGGSNSRYTFAMMGEALAGKGSPTLRSPIYDNDLVIVGLLPNGGVDRLEVFEGVVRDLRARGLEVLLVTDEAFAKKGESNGLWRDGYFVRKMADRYGCALADTAAYMREAELRGETVYKDQIHANQDGYRLWAQAIDGVLSPGISLAPDADLDASIAASSGPTLLDATLVPDDALVDFMPKNTGGILVATAPDNRFLKVFDSPDGGVWKMGSGSSLEVNDRQFMALDLLLDSSSEFSAEVRDANGRKIQGVSHSAIRGAGARAEVLTAVSAKEMSATDKPPATVVVTSGELRLYAVIYQTRNEVR